VTKRGSASGPAPRPRRPRRGPARGGARRGAGGGGGKRFGELAGQVGVLPGEFASVDRLLETAAHPLPVVVGNGSLGGEGEGDPLAPERLVHRGDGVERLGEADEGCALVDGLADFHGRAPRRERCPGMDGQLGKRLIGCQNRDGYEFSGLVVEIAGVEDFAEDEALEDPHELRVITFVDNRFAAEELREFLRGQFDSPHGQAPSGVGLCQCRVFGVGDGLQPFGAGLLSGDLDGDVAEPRIRFGAMPMLGARGDDDDVAGVQASRGLAFLLVPAASRDADEDLPPPPPPGGGGGGGGGGARGRHAAGEEDRSVARFRQRIDVGGAGEILGVGGVLLAFAENVVPVEFVVVCHSSVTLRE